MNDTGTQPTRHDLLMEMQHDLIDAITVATHANLQIGYTSMTNDDGWNPTGFGMDVYTHSAEEFVAAARNLAPRRVHKTKGDRGIELVVNIGSCTITVKDLSGQVCTRVPVGTDTIVEEIADPDAPKITRTREVTRYEYQCPPSILAIDDTTDTTTEAPA